jgi:hypothetical protein
VYKPITVCVDSGGLADAVGAASGWTIGGGGGAFDVREHAAPRATETKRAPLASRTGPPLRRQPEAGVANLDATPPERGE